MNEIDVNHLLSQLRAMSQVAQGQGLAPAQEAGTPDFSALLKNSIGQVNESQQAANKLSDAFESGDPQVDLSQVMVALQKASLSFQTMVQVRNKLVAAYQDVMNMQM